MKFVKITEWGNCQICGEHEDLRFGICGNCAKIWKSQGGKWEWDKDNPNLAKLSCSGRRWYCRKDRPDFLKEGEL